jgi:hypothetical protein
VLDDVADLLRGHVDDADREHRRRAVPSDIGLAQVGRGRQVPAIRRPGWEAPLAGAPHALGDDAGAAAVSLGNIDLDGAVGGAVLEGQLAVMGKVGPDGISRQLGEGLVVL